VRLRPAPPAVSGECDQPDLADKRGDGGALDIVAVRLRSDCSSWTLDVESARPVRSTNVTGWAMGIDSQRGRGGCNGDEHLVAVYPEEGTLVAYVLRTPSCKAGEWATVERVEVARPNARTLQVTFRGSSIGNASSFAWSTAVRGRGSARADIAPDSGRQRTIVPTPSATRLVAEVAARTARVNWLGIECGRGVRFSQRVTIAENGGMPEEVRGVGRSSEARFTQLTAGSTYVVSVTMVCGSRPSAPATVSFSIPEGAFP
jgi:hypothetical protein